MKPDAGARVLDGEECAENVCVVCAAAGASWVADADTVVQAGEGELVKSAAARLVFAALTAPAELVEPKRPPGALSAVTGGSVLQVAGNCQNHRNRRKIATALHPAAGRAQSQALPAEAV